MKRLDRKPREVRKSSLNFERPKEDLYEVAEKPSPARGKNVAGCCSNASAPPERGERKPGKKKTIKENFSAAKPVRQHCTPMSAPWAHKTLRVHVNARWSNSVPWFGGPVAEKWKRSGSVRLVESSQLKRSRHARSSSR